MARLALNSCRCAAVALIFLLALPPRATPLDMPETPYTGSLHVLFTCSMPPFVCEALVDVEIMWDGTVDIGETTMEYGGSMPVDEDCTYARYGSWEIVPIGTYQSGPPRHLAVDENVAYNEQITLTCPGYEIETTDSGNLNGGLAFDIDDAVTTGAVVAVTTENGDGIVWTLHLIPQLPVERVGWSTVKARYLD